MSNLVSRSHRGEELEELRGSARARSPLTIVGVIAESMPSREQLRWAVRSIYAVGVLFFAVALLRAQTLTPEQRAVLAGRIAAAVRQTAEEQHRAASIPFVGVTTDGRPLPGLFPLRSAGVSTAPIRLAAEALLATLTPAQREAITLPVDGEAWRRWVSTGVFVRADGIQLADMAAAQRSAALRLLESSLSSAGMTETLNVMRLNESQVELTRDSIPNDLRPHPFGQWSYWLALFGSPDPREPWGWQLEGHHLVINYFVLGDQVVMTPTFMGAEPAKATSGQFAGTAALQGAQIKGWELFASLTADQRTQATIRTQKGRDEGVAGAFQDTLVLEYTGIRGVDLSAAQRELLLAAIAEYVHKLPEGHARPAMEQVRTHLNDTHFAWIGDGDPGTPFYYRIHSPVILIEFDHPPMRDGTASQNHIHTIVRTPNGNDYGRDLLRQHYAQHHEPHAQQAVTERPEPRSELEAFAARFLSAIANADWDSFREFWSADAIMYAPGRTDAVRIEGIEALQRVWQRQFDLMRGAAQDRGVTRPPFVTLVARDLRVDYLAPDVAVVSFHLDDDGRIRRRTPVAARRWSRWLITHLHASDVAGQAKQ